MAKSDLVRAAIAFQEWGKPWSFDSVVLNQLSDDSDDRAIFMQIWAEACRSDNWQQADISRCCDACDSRLKCEFSWLPEEAGAQFVRAASFQWK
ncbi:hypothetical protein QYH69_33015 [Paraburkholderia sp. SARCC-3016]|uniref:hypothetical protein n=1 Tax=Paraburkholderia sp. SARCC-3016 TaxID=3058611 RepID=UPI0028068B36|nr:hypothetical protein [Paraburkholderia sp. SARCC-3016]MDQ7982048.1 hypothetical protein [Paraburkholderia sp. SARCC-3016]